MIAPHYYLIVMLVSADAFYQTPLSITSPYIEIGAQEIPSNDPRDIKLGSILSSDNIMMAIPIFDPGFKAKLNNTIITVAEDEPEDEGFEVEDESIHLDEDEEFCLDNTLTTDVTPVLVE